MPKKYSNEEFLKLIKQIHGDKYDYNKTLYNNKRNKVMLTCLKHGDFEKWPSALINGEGCVECSNELRQIRLLEHSKLTRKNRKENFLKKASQVHGNKYDYSVMYLTS